jgi:hypothetical protein
MKSERRHNLETNELAVRVQDWIEQLKPYASQIALVIVGLLVLAFLASAWGSTTSATDQAAWDEFTLATYSSDPEWNSMKMLANNEEFAGTPVPEWAFLAWSDRQLLLASHTYLTDRKATTDRLKEVQKIYMNLAEGASNPQIQDRARYGLAQALEMQGKLDEAIKEYDAVKGNLAALAAQRVEKLKTDDAKQAWEWLTTAELPARPAAGAAAPASRPAFDAEVPATVPNNALESDAQSLQQILSGQNGATDENRYGESEDAEVAEEAADDETQYEQSDEAAEPLNEEAEPATKAAE